MRLDVKVDLSSLSETLADDACVVKLDQLLEVLQQWDVSLSDAPRKLVPFPD